MAIDPLPTIVQQSINADNTSRGNLIALLGDSITANNSSISGQNTLWLMGSGGYFVHANQRLNQRFDLVYQSTNVPTFGISGATTTSMLANGYINQIVNSQANVVAVMIGTNDLTNSTANGYIAIWNRLVQIYDAIRLSGKRLIVCTITPRLVVSDTTDVIANHHALNDLIRNYAIINNNVILCDWYNVLVDPTTGRANQIYLGDDIHPNILGASRLGNYLANVLNPLIPLRNILDHSGNPRNVAPTGAFTEADANSTVSVTTVNTSDVDPRNWTQIACTAISSTDAASYARVLKISSASVNAGDQYQASIEFQTDSASWNVKAFYLLLKVNGGPADATYDGYAVASSTVMDRPSSGVFRTPVLTIPAGATTLQMEIRQYGVGTTRVRGESMVKVN